MLVVAGCSSSSGSDSKDSADSATPSAKGEPLVAPAKYKTLPEACQALSSGTIGNLVPKAKLKGGTPGKSNDISKRGSCSWNGLDDKGVKGSQYRWLDITLSRYDSDQSLGSGAARAGKQYAQEVADAKTAEGAKDLKTGPSTGIGNEATLVTYTLKKTGTDFSYATIVARTENAVLTLNYNGAGYAGEETPSVSDVTKDAITASKEAVAFIAAAGLGTGSGAGSGSSAGSGSGSSAGSGAGSATGGGSGKGSSASPSHSPSHSASPSHSPSHSPSPSPSKSSAKAE
jgi:hypothetical protein